MRGAGLSDLWSERLYPTHLATRLTSQTADGVFQTSLAGAVLFNPEHHTGPAQVATGFVVLLLPYSLIGPFAGVFLDRWRRQRVLLYGAATRSVLVAIAATILVTHGPRGFGFVLAALGALAVNRFYLAALSASLPSVVSTERLVLANAVSPTAGTVMTIVGGGIGLGFRAAGGGADHGDALAALIAGLGYLAASAVSTRLPADSLGPHPPSDAPLREALSGIVRGMLAGARHVRDRPAAADALAVIFAQRFLFGIWSIMTLLLYRNEFRNDGILRSGLVGVGQAVSAAGVGLVLAAAVTPWITARIGKSAWIVIASALAAVTIPAFGAAFSMSLLLVSALALGFAVQATKVCVDTLVQSSVDDAFRGRVFALYDTTYNLSFVGGALVAAFTLPTDGRSLGALIAMSGGFALTALAYGAAQRRGLDREPAEHSAEQPA